MYILNLLVTRYYFSNESQPYAFGGNVDGRRRLSEAMRLNEIVEMRRWWCRVWPFLPA